MPLFHRLPFQLPACHGLKWKDALEELGAGGRAGVACRPRLMLLRSSHILSVLVRSMQSSGSGGGEKCQAPTHLQQWFSASGSGLLSSCITTLVLSVQGQLVVNSRTLRPSVNRPQELNVYPGAVVLAGYGAHTYCFCTCYRCYVCEFGGGEQWRGKYRRRNVLGFPLTVSM